MTSPQPFDRLRFVSTVTDAVATAPHREKKEARPSLVVPHARFETCRIGGAAAVTRGTVPPGALFSSDAAGTDVEGTASGVAISQFENLFTKFLHLHSLLGGTHTASTRLATPPQTVTPARMFGTQIAHDRTVMSDQETAPQQTDVILRRLAELAGKIDQMGELSGPHFMYDDDGGSSAHGAVDDLQHGGGSAGGNRRGASSVPATRGRGGNTRSTLRKRGSNGFDPRSIVNAGHTSGDNVSLAKTVEDNCSIYQYTKERASMDGKLSVLFNRKVVFLPNTRKRCLWDLWIMALVVFYAFLVPVRVAFYKSSLFAAEEFIDWIDFGTGIAFLSCATWKGGALAASFTDCVKRAFGAMAKATFTHPCRRNGTIDELFQRIMQTEVVQVFGCNNLVFWLAASTTSSTNRIPQ